MAEIKVFFGNGGEGIWCDKIKISTPFVPLEIERIFDLFTFMKEKYGKVQT